MGTHSNTVVDDHDVETFRALKPYLSRALSLNHDINNPLCAILGYAEYILSEKNLEPDLRANIEHIMRAGEQIRTLVDALSIEKLQATENCNLSALTDRH